MRIDADILDDLRDAWRSGELEAVRQQRVVGLTLGAAIEAACWHAVADADVRALLASWCPVSEHLVTAVAGLGEGVLPRPEDHAAPEFELRRCPSRSELQSAAAGVEWRYFLDRFRRSLRTRLGESSSSARGLAAALHEMVDNVVEHAGLGDRPRGIVGYRVAGDAFEFAVADLGRGMLASLQDNPAHVELTTDGDALSAAVTGGASRRPGAPGTGFSQLLRALADVEGVWFFRSGGARLRLDGRGTGHRVAASSNSPRMQGFQLSITARPTGRRW